MEIRKGTERGVMWGYGENVWDNRGMDETWVHLRSREGTDYLTVSVGIEEIVDILENAFENNVEEGSQLYTEVMEQCNKLRNLIKEVVLWQTMNR